MGDAEAELARSVTLGASPQPLAPLHVPGGRRATVAFGEDSLPQRSGSAPMSPGALTPGGSRSAKDKECFINLNITLQRLDTHQQTFTITGYANALWRMEDLEAEALRQDYYDHGADGSVDKTVKELIADESQAVKTSSARGIRRFVTGFQLSVESDVLPFSPKRMFEDRRIVPGSFDSEANYYYYPMEQNRVEDRLQEAEDQPDFEREKLRLELESMTADDGEHLKCAGMIKMAVKFSVELTQKLNMRK